MHKYYIADPHFGHKAVIDMCRRPFASIEEMDRTLIENWNAVVRPDDEVYVLGDFMYRSGYTPDYYLSKLKGRKHLILGNHDSWTKTVDLTRYFESVSQMLEITDQSRHLVLFHYPMAEWPRFYRDSLHVFGHIHNDRRGDAFRYYRSNPRMLNAGVDVNGYMPVRLEQLIENNERFREAQDGDL